jgi:hypothetical protein
MDDLQHQMLATDLIARACNADMTAKWGASLREVIEVQRDGTVSVWPAKLVGA